MNLELKRKKSIRNRDKELDGLLLCQICHSNFVAIETESGRNQNDDQLLKDKDESFQKNAICNYLDSNDDGTITQLELEYLIEKLNMKWDEKIWYDESCINCEQDSPEFRKVISIENDEILEGNCIEHNVLRIFSKFTEKLEDMPGVDKIVKLTKFELKNLTITNE